MIFGPFGTDERINGNMAIRLGDRNRVGFDAKLDALDRVSCFQLALIEAAMKFVPFVTSCTTSLQRGIQTRLLSTAVRVKPKLRVLHSTCHNAWFNLATEEVQ